MKGFEWGHGNYMAPILVVLEDLRIMEENAVEWQRYTYSLKGTNVGVKEEKHQLVWSLNPSGEYVPKLGYKDLTEEVREELHVWW